MDDLALGRSLTLAVRLLVDEMHERHASEGFDYLRPAFGYVLNAARTSALSASDIGALLGITKQGAAKLLAEMEAAGYIVRRNSETDARVRAVELTVRGHRALGAAERAQDAIEQRWERLSSSRDMKALRRVLAAVIDEAASTGMPPLRPAW